jgi:orotidine-5'-phosphate decarboxylase
MVVMPQHNRLYDVPPMQPRDRLIVALDRSSREEILALGEELHERAGVFKLGLQAFVSNGPGMVREFVAARRRVFLDLKLHDIPNTVAGAVTEAARLGAFMLTVHAGGGHSMMEAAARAKAGSGLLILGVTVLTSLSEADLLEIGFGASPVDLAVRMARAAQDAGLDGVVASPLEIEAIREACGSGLLIVTPGVRAEGESTGDQARTMSAAKAVAAGADYIVVGRPITDAPDRVEAARRIVDSYR